LDSTERDGERSKNLGGSGMMSVGGSKHTKFVRVRSPQKEFFLHMHNTNIDVLDDGALLLLRLYCSLANKFVGFSMHNMYDYQRPQTC